jgi:hypothetical protein
MKFNKSHLIQLKCLFFSGSISFLGCIFFMGCNPSKFQVDTYNSDKNSTSEKTTNKDNVPAPLSCELSANKLKANIGDDVKFSFKANFEIPKNSQMILSGKSFGNNLNFNPEWSKFYFELGISYKLDIQAGIHKRQIKLINSNGDLICTSNLLKVEFIGNISADQVCAQSEGQLTGEDNEVCSVDGWNLYKIIREKNIQINQEVQTGSSLGMANPAALLCENVSGVYTNSGICNLNKYKLQNILNSVVAGPGI